MSRARLACVVFFSLFAPFAVAQNAPASTPSASTQGAALLQKALLALAPGPPITDATLSGTARRIAGSDDESGTVVIKALAGTGTRLDLSLPSGTRTEIRNVSGGPAGSWSDPDGVAHTMAYTTTFSSTRAGHPL